MIKKQIQILHISDIHLDNEIGSGKEKSAAQIGLESSIDAATENNVDLILLAGDLFDHNRIKAECLNFVDSEFGRLPCPLVMITGNHDCLAEYSIYKQYNPAAASKNVFFLRGDGGTTCFFKDLGLTIWGRGIVEHHPGYKPLEHVPVLLEEGWYVGVAHGYYVGRELQSFSSLITPEEIEASNFDYLALGHVHVFSVMEHGSTTAAYSGSPNKDIGKNEMSAALVELNPKKGVLVKKLDLLPRPL